MIKWIGAAIGFIFKNIFGAFIGYTIGSLIDNFINQTSESNTSQQNQTRSSVDFRMSFLTLIAAIMKADGQVTKNELDFVKASYRQNFGIEKTQEDMLKLRDILKSQLYLNDACSQIRSNMPTSEKSKLLDFLFGIALADSSLTNNELAVLKKICYMINLSDYDFQSAYHKATGSGKRSYYEYYHQEQNTHYYNPNNLNESYTTLGITASATDDELKKSYRSLVRKYHPDKYANKTTEELKSAEEKFKKIQQAYDQIKKSRGLN